LIRAEELAVVYKKYAHLRGKIKSGGLSCVKVPADPNVPADHRCQQWRTVVEPEEILDRLLNRLQQHFGQGKDSTWTSGPLDTTHDFTGVGERAEAILNATYDPDPQLSPQAKKLVEFLAYASPLSADKIPWEVTPAEFQGKIVNWDERRSTSPTSNVHLGHA
jgi:hypothetical protein